MKYWFMFQVGLFACSTIVGAQNPIPSAAFENWTDGEPDNWNTSNFTDIGIYNVMPTTNSHSGSYGLRAEKNISTFGPADPQINSEFRINERFLYLKGWYVLAPVEGDKLYVYISLTKDGTGLGGTATALLTATDSTYRPFTIPINYNDPEVIPDGAYIGFKLCGSATPGVCANPHTGSYFLLDDLEFSDSPLSSKEGYPPVPADIILHQNYPNPFNPRTQIRYDLPRQEYVRLTLDDILGRVVTALVDGKEEAGYKSVELDASLLPSGVYFYRLTVESKTVVKRLVVMK